MKNKDLDQRSERGLARLAGVSRTSLRAIKAGEANPTIKTLRQISEAQNHELRILEYPKNSELDSSASMVAASLKTQQDGFDSWKIHFFDFVDEVRRSKDYRLVLLPPIKSLDKKLSALAAAITLELCKTYSLEEPTWAVEMPALQEPWFVSNSESLKATSLLESPLRFKLKNIFVLENFLDRT